MRKLYSPLIWRLTWTNVFVITLFIILTGSAVYQFACFLVDQFQSVGSDKQQMFNESLFQYLVRISVLAIIIGAIVHYYLTKKILQPIRRLVTSTQVLTLGRYPEPIPVRSNDEIGQLTEHFNQLIARLKQMEENRSQMISDMAHELRTPLSNMNGYLEGLSRGVIEGNPSLYASLHQETKRVIQLVDQLYRLTEWDMERKEGPLAKERVDIKKLTEECLTLYKVEMDRKQVMYTLDMDPEELDVHAHGIQQVLMNLLDNAIRYKEGTDPIHLSGRKRKKDYKISITGQGSFIPDHQKERIFERFYRIDPSRSRQTGGSGLGLAIVKDIVERHGGEVGLDTDGHVHTFWLTLPLPET